MFNSNTYPAYVSEDFVDEILGELTELADSRDSNFTMWQTAATQVRVLKSDLEDFVRDAHGSTDARAIIEALCDRFALDATREIQTTIHIQVNITADAPYTMSRNEISQALSNVIVDLDSYDTDMDVHFDVVDIYVDSIQEN